MADHNNTAGAPHIAIVGGGLAGLAAAIKVAETGMPVDLFSIVPVKRSHSVCAQGGINGAANTKGEGDSPWEHFDDTIYGGDFLANQPPVKDMCEAAPSIIYLLDRMGVRFNRTSEGLLDYRRFGGTKYQRTAYAGATTGQQLLYALDEQVRRFEVAGLVRKFEGWEFLSPIIDDGPRCRGLTALNMATLEVRAFAAEAVIVATGGPGLIFGRTTNSLINTGAAVGACCQAGAQYANGEFIQVHPTAIPGADKLRLMSESARGEGGRVWVPKRPGDGRQPGEIPEGERFYFLEDWYPAYGNLVPRDVATRAIHRVVFEEGLGVGGKQQVYLDLSHLPAEFLDRKLGGILEIYEKFVGEDPRQVPMRVFPAVHYSMGGIWVDFDQQTSVPGLFAAGECEYQYHGANRLGANSLLSCIFGGFRAGPNAAGYVGGLNGKAGAGAPSSLLEKAQKAQDARLEDLKRRDGGENVFRLHDELGEVMTANVTVIRYNDKLRIADEKIQEIKERWRSARVHDRNYWANRELLFLRQFEVMLDLARVMTLGALRRDESRGSHYKPDFPERDDEKFLKTTKAKLTAGDPEFSYEDVDIGLIEPRKRVYDVDKHETEGQPASQSASAS